MVGPVMEQLIQRTQEHVSRSELPHPDVDRYGAFFEVGSWTGYGHVRSRANCAGTIGSVLGDTFSGEPAHVLLTPSLATELRLRSSLLRLKRADHSLALCRLVMPVDVLLTVSVVLAVAHFARQPLNHL